MGEKRFCAAIYLLGSAEFILTQRIRINGIELFNFWGLYTKLSVLVVFSCGAGDLAVLGGACHTLG